MRFPKSTFVLILALIIIGALLFSCAKKQTGDIRITKENGVTIVNNPARPLYPYAKLIYKEELSIGREEGDTNYVFYRISGVHADNEGKIYVLNSGSYQMRVFDNSEKFLYAFGKKGQGPGEFMARFLQFDMDEKGVIYVSDFQNRRISSFTSKGERLQDFTLKESFPRSFEVDAAGNLFCSLSILGKSPEERKVTVKKFNMNGKELIDFGEFEDTKIKIIRSGKMAISVITGLEKGPEWTISKDGKFYFGTKDEYEISIFSPENHPLRKIRKKCSPIPVTAKEIAEMKKRYTKMPAAIRDQIEFPDHKPAFNRFFVDDREYLWINCPTEFGAKGRLFDIFNPEGKYFYRTKLPFMPAYIKNGKIYTHERDENGVEMVKRYSYRWEK